MVLPEDSSLRIPNGLGCYSCADLPFHRRAILEARHGLVSSTFSWKGSLRYEQLP